MSVLMTLRVSGDAKAIEQTSSEVLHTITSRAKEHGVISHHFYGTDNEVLVVDEWPDEQSFQAFFDASPEVADMMERAHAGKPEIHFWRHLDVDDDIG
jgi:heme-degrading monooxygenase HmoA